nr:MAG TPA: hypothetical protein [Caudoviricetes sp.]
MPIRKICEILMKCGKCFLCAGASLKCYGC